MSEVAVGSESAFANALAAAAKLPGVRIDRAGYLRRSLQRECTEQQIIRAIVSTPAAASSTSGGTPAMTRPSTVP